MTDKKRSTPKGFAAWVHKHDRLLSVIGALTVAATFVVRDAFREHLKDVSSSIELAQAEYDRAVFQDEMRDSLGDLSEQVSDLRPGTRLEPKTGDEMSEWEHNQYENDLDRLENLQRKVPSSTKEHNLATIESLREGMRAHTLKPVYAQSSLGLKFPTWPDFDKIHRQVLSEAQGYREKLERWYSRCTTLSYFLYAFGAGLTIIGKVYKVETGGAE